MCAISWPMAVVSTSSDGSASRDSGRMMVRPAVTGPEIRCGEEKLHAAQAVGFLAADPHAFEQLRNCRVMRGPADLERAHGCPGQPGETEEDKQKPGAQQDGRRGLGDGDGAGSRRRKNRARRWRRRARRGPVRQPLPCVASEGSNCGVAVGSTWRTLASGSRIAAARAATQTACRWLAGPLRMNRQASAATRGGQRNLPEGIEQESKQRAANRFHVLPPADAPAAFESARVSPESVVGFPPGSAPGYRPNLQKNGRACRRPPA